MRKLIITRGLSGSGKSTWIEQNGLKPWTICPDDLRLLYRSPTYTNDGKFTIDQANDRKVWETLYTILEERMERGELVVIDATHKTNGDFTKYQNLASKYHYRIACADFSNITLETAIEQNNLRAEYKQVPVDAITRQYHKLKDQNVPKAFYTIDITNAKSLENFLKIDIKDLSSYKKIHNIGDIQGCFTPLNEYFETGIKDDEFYIFSGDYIDRGIENGATLKFIIDISKRKNVVLLMGNHERHLLHWSSDLPPKAAEFTKNTLPQLLESEITKQQVKDLVYRMRDIFAYTYYDKNIIVTHGGIGKIPDFNKVGLIASKTFWNGTGTYDGGVDQIFNEQNTGWLQIHGHRNVKSLPIHASKTSFNLEASIEFGGTLRIVTFEYNDKVQIETIEIPNTVYKGYKERLKDPELKSIDPVDEPWFVQNDTFTNKMSIELFDQLHNHKLIKAKKSEDTLTHITSFSFTRKAFYDKAWDETNIKARGLFVNNVTREVVARSYDKFFNLEENEQNQKYNLQKNLQYPVTIYTKENGFLGLVGYDRSSDSLFLSSKSTHEGEFANNFARIFDNIVPKHKQETIKRLLRDQEACLVFEVIDPVNDPHIIEYTKEDIILLDIVARNENFIRADYKQLEKFAHKFDLKYKKRLTRLHNWNELNGWLGNVLKPMDLDEENLEYSIKEYINKIQYQVEGYVIEDSNNYMFKVKCPFYALWKEMRNNKERLEKNSNAEIKLREQSVIGKSFIEFMQKQTAENLKKDIITLRKQYFERIKPDLK